MIAIKAYTEKLIRFSRFNEELADDDFDGIAANIACGRRTETREILVYTACGETRAEAEKSLRNYLTHIKFDSKITRKEVEKSV